MSFCVDQVKRIYNLDDRKFVISKKSERIVLNGWELLCRYTHFTIDNGLRRLFLTNVVMTSDSVFP